MKRPCTVRGCRSLSIEDGNRCSEHVRELLYETRREAPWVTRAREGRLMPKTFA